MMGPRFFQLFAFALLFSFLSISFAQNEREVTTPEEGPTSHLLEGVLNNDSDMVDQAIADGENIDITNVNGWSAAMFATAKGDLDLLEKLVKAGIDLNQHNNEGLTPLMTAAAQGDKEIVEV